jgi:hypothetical protein
MPNEDLKKNTYNVKSICLVFLMNERCNALRIMKNVKCKMFERFKRNQVFLIRKFYDLKID